MAESHIRIDDGIKRGPRKPKTTLEATRAPYTVALRPLHHLDPAERQSIANSVLDRYINGEQVAKIAPDHNVSDVTIYALLLRENQEAWKDVQTARALARLERAQDDLATAPDALSLARARELVRSAQWELERLLNRLYAQKQELTGKDGGPLQVQIVRFGAQAGEVIDAEVIEPVVAPTPNAAVLPPITPKP